MDLIEKTLSKKYIFNGKIINLRVDEALLPNGATANREVVEHPGGVCIAPLTKNNELIFVKQFRYPYSEVVLELPAGKLEYFENP
ncbi:MAG: ADP-ribose pyrophosphatase, partial [Oscillospiraceae bacterium]